MYIQTIMNYSQIRKMDISNGPGIRVSIFVSGCTLHCKGCFNYELWDFNSGKPFTDKELNSICEELDKPHIKGLSILGGEPLDNLEGVTTLVEAIRKRFTDTKYEKKKTKEEKKENNSPINKPNNEIIRQETRKS